MAKIANKSDEGLSKLVKQVRTAFRSMQNAEREEASARSLAAARRLELGKLLSKARERWPQSGPNARGWGEFLRRCEINEDVALVAMKYAGFVAKVLPAGAKIRPGELPTLAEAGLAKPETKTPQPEADRDTWCTPKWIADAIGEWDLDPCSNERSVIQAKRAICLPEDGLVEAALVTSTDRVFVNPPYSNVGPWVERYGHTRFCFLVKFDPSTKWCEQLLERTELVLFPRRTRVEFTPPPEVEGGNNPFPHGLFFAHAEDATPEIRELCFEFTHAGVAKQ